MKQLRRIRGNILISFKRPTEHRNIKAFGTRSLISNTRILEEKYYKQDSVTLHISVEVLPSL